MVARCWTLAKQRVDYLLGFIGALAFIYVSLETFWSDSEMWASVVVKYMFQNSPIYVFTIKPLFNFFLWLNYQWSLALNVHPMVTGRFLMALNGLFCLFIVARIVLYQTKNRTAAFLGVFLLFALSTFLKRGGNVRSDMLVTNMILLGVYWQVTDSSVSKVKNLFGSIVLWMAALFVSPKAIFFTAPLVFYTLSKKLLKKKNNFFILSGLFTFLLLVIFFLKDELRLYLEKSLLFFWNSFNEQESGFSYFDPIRLMYVVRFIKENIIILLLTFGFAILNKVGSRTMHRPPGEKFSSISFWAASFILLFYPDRLPFLIASLLPFFVLSLCLNFFVFCKKSFSYWIFILACFTSLAYWARDGVLYHSNSEQRLVSSWLDQEFLSLPKLKIWDPSGVLPHTSAEYYFLGPAQDIDNHANFYFVRDAEADIFLYTKKAIYLEPELSMVLNAKYRDLGGGVFVRKNLESQLGSNRINQIQKELMFGFKGQHLSRLFRFDVEY